MRLAQQSFLNALIALGLLSLFVTLGLSFFVYKKASGLLEENLVLTLDQAVRSAGDFYYEIRDDALTRTNGAAVAGNGVMTDEDCQRISERLATARIEGGLLELFIFDPAKNSVADAKPKRRGQRYTNTTLPREVTRQLDRGKTIFHRAEADDMNPFRTRSCVAPLRDNDDNIIAWIFAQSDIRNEEVLDARLDKLAVIWRVAALVASFFTLLMFAWMAQLMRRSSEIQRKVNEQARVGMLSLLSSALMHEIKTPLATIDGSGQLIRKHFRETQGDEQLGELADYIVSESERIKDIINTSLGTGNTSEIVSLELHAFGKKIVSALYPSLSKKRVTVDNTIGPGIRVRAAVLPLRLVFTNLITNAVQAVPEGAGQITLASIKRGNQIGIQIMDNGKGIPKRKFKNLYQLFSSDKKGGSGIGLAASAQAVREMHGTIEVTSTVGKGTTFTVWLPAAKDSS